MSLELDFPGRKDRNQSKNNYIFSLYERKIQHFVDYLLLFPPELFSLSILLHVPRRQLDCHSLRSVFQVMLSVDSPKGKWAGGRVRSGCLFSTPWMCSWTKVTAPCRPLSSRALSDFLYLLPPLVPFGLKCNNTHSYYSWDFTYTVLCGFPMFACSCVSTLFIKLS